MTDSLNHKLYYKVEGTYGTTPTSPDWTPFKHTAINIALTKATFASDIIESHHQVADFRHGNKSTAGDVNTELSFADFDDLLEAGFCGTFAAKATKTATTISAAAADNSYNDSGNGFVTAGFEVGDIIQVTGFTGNVANNITRGVITSVAAGKIIIGGTDGNVIVDDAAGESVTIATVTQRLKLGTTRRSFSLLRHFSDLTSGDKPFHVLVGQEVAKIALSAKAGEKITATFSFIGRDLSLPAETAPSGSTYLSQTSNRIFDAFSGFLKEGGTEVGIVTEFTGNIETGIAADRFVVGTDLMNRPILGKFKISGQVSLYFENDTHYNKFINATDSSLILSIDDLDGNNMKIGVPKFKYTGGAPDVSATGAVMLSMPFEAYYDSTTATTVYIDATEAA